jgi:hypothetical protein
MNLERGLLANKLKTMTLFGRANSVMLETNIGPTPRGE